MNRNIFFAVLIFVFGIFSVSIARAMPDEVIKLPYERGQSFVVVQGYDSPPTHINKDLYAIDFSQDACDAYGKAAVAAESGRVMLAQESGYNGGYGTQVLILGDDDVISRYAHMIPGSIPIVEDSRVLQGQPIGQIGDTGLVAGAACPIHPGTHLHFAMYRQSGDGSFTASLPEPISGYTHITPGNWYLSDNELTSEEISSAFNLGSGEVLGAATTAAAIASTTPDAAASSSPTPINSPPVPQSGGVTVILSPPAPPANVQPVISATDTIPVSTSTPDTISTSTPSSSPPVAAPIVPQVAQASATFNSSTLAIDLVWQPLAPPSASTTDSTATTTTTSAMPVYQVSYLGTAASSTSVFLATTTATNFSYPLASLDYGSMPQFTIIAFFDNEQSTVITASVSIPAWWTVVQPLDDAGSIGSWYDDNWYDLGAGFSGTVLSMTFEGLINSSQYLASHLILQEYLDPNYSQLDQQFTISDGAPFTNVLQRITIGGLNIPLQPDKYYRLMTWQDYQNRSVILLGTTATGTAMWDEFVYGIGGVHHTYSFYPYLGMVVVPAEGGVGGSL